MRSSAVGVVVWDDQLDQVVVDRFIDTVRSAVARMAVTVVAHEVAALESLGHADRVRVGRGAVAAVAVVTLFMSLVVILIAHMTNERQRRVRTRE